jgi:hypothetical protein
MVEETSMGSLKPGATYVYEHSDGIVYAREQGARPEDRFVVGYEYNTDYDPTRADRTQKSIMMREAQLWQDIRETAQYNVALQDAVDHMIEIYELVRDYERQT